MINMIYFIKPENKWTTLSAWIDNRLFYPYSDQTVILIDIGIIYTASGMYSYPDDYLTLDWR